MNFITSFPWELPCFLNTIRSFMIKDGVHVSISSGMTQHIVSRNLILST